MSKNNHDKRRRTQSYDTYVKMDPKDFLKIYEGLNLFPIWDQKAVFYLHGENGERYEIKSASVRYKNFYRHKEDLTCSGCKIEATEAYIEKPSKQKGSNKCHVNFYGVNKEGDRVLFSKLVKSGNEKNDVSKMELICRDCLAELNRKRMS